MFRSSFPFRFSFIPILVDAPLIPRALCQLSAQAPAATSVRSAGLLGDAAVPLHQAIEPFSIRCCIDPGKFGNKEQGICGFVWVSCRIFFARTIAGLPLCIFLVQPKDTKLCLCTVCRVICCVGYLTAMLR